ncbi:hypothetical protein VD0002_g2463 [Verticillium dahliae]|uniref:Uncharacterized protein n=2 Tax=Verticillium dahliae TaxID=27337 RepID=G2WWZ7_VERDV|nr:uncharacterized protein VDAG_02776 [Verticillium dahliae VdLs.17]KAF3351238.1 hypothetical protein VdG2_00745 [Verticillium dahliae VDG2]KAH6707238.1 hypothetical protein EV126DRAFT_157320 [Verticillium dahliae]EGY21252.1 hypothetical protein VDAG_02776 [Verticillium dahliae VdLs.17]PNH30410.1 hypothetical protein BJF96_g6295 [Verticillium dahliae]PNH43002.1 hypothetical protein VD0004_g4417 [Verticillium dahliae]
MRFSTLSGTALAAASGVMAKELAKDLVKGAELYDSGYIHERNMKHKMDAWMGEFDAGLLNSEVWPRLNYTKCIDGKAAAVPGNELLTFRCKNIDLYDFINFATLGSPNGWDELGDGNLLTGSGSWGWTDPKTGREFAAIGMFDGTAFVEILKEGRLAQLGFLPVPAKTNPNALWKEIRGFKNYMIIGSELAGHGVQIFDMSKLLTVNASAGPVVFDIVKDVTAHWKDLPNGQTHNIVVDEENEYFAAVGARPRTDVCKSGLIFVDLKDPSNPKRLGCNGQDGYVHDAQCLTYHGPDTKYEGHQICYGYNEDTLTIYDVTDKANSKILSVTSYEGASYTHQGWVLDVNWQEYLLMDDEYDETDGLNPASDGYPVTYIWDIRSLEAPKNTGIYKGTVVATDHNQYIKNGLSFQSSYGAGFRVYDVSSIPEDPTGAGVCEIAYFDIFPEDDNQPGGGSVEMFGSWSSYQFDGSGYAIINTIERGVYLVKMTKRASCPKKQSCNADNCLRSLRSSSIKGRLEESQKFCGEFTKTYVSDVKVVPEYASKACGTNVISRVSSACHCLPTPTA